MTKNLDEILRSTADVLFPEAVSPLDLTVASRNRDGDTPLHVLAWRGDSDGAKVLLEAAADPNAIGDMGETPLHVACRVRSHDLVELLLAAGARSDIRGEFDVTPAQIAAQDPELAALFLNRSA